MHTVQCSYVWAFGNFSLRMLDKAHKCNQLCNTEYKTIKIKLNIWLIVEHINTCVQQINRYARWSRCLIICVEFFSLFSCNYNYSISIFSGFITTDKHPTTLSIDRLSCYANVCVLNDPKRKQKFNDFKCKVAWFLHLPLLVRSKGSSLQCRYYFSSSCWPIVIQKERWALFEWNFVTKGIQIQTEWKNAFTQWLLRLLVLRITPISLRILHVLHVRKLLPRQMI